MSNHLVVILDNWRNNYSGVPRALKLIRLTPLPLLYISSTVCQYPHYISHIILTNSLNLYPTTLNSGCSVAYVIHGFVLIPNINLILVLLLVFFLVTFQHKVSILSILVVIQFPQQINLSTLLLNRFHEATSKNYRRLASPPELRGHIREFITIDFLSIFKFF